ECEASREMPRLVIYAVAVSELLDHLEVEHRSLMESLRLEQPSGRGELREARVELRPDGRDGPFERLLRGRVEGPRVEGDPLQLLERRPPERVRARDLLDFVAEVLDPDGDVLVRGMELEDVSANAERAAREIEVRALVLHLDQLGKESPHAGAVSDFDVGEHVVVRLGRAQPVNAGDRGDDD